MYFAFCHTVPYEDAIAYAKVRRQQLPLIYNERRIYEEPIPNLSVSVHGELHPNAQVDPFADVKQEEELVIFSVDVADREELRGLLDEAVFDGDANDGDNSDTDAETETAKQDTASNNDDSENYNAESNNITAAAENVNTEKGAVRMPAAVINHVADQEPNVSVATSADDSEVEILVDLNTPMPMPMASLLDGFVKHEDDEISGNLCYKLIVC